MRRYQTEVLIPPDRYVGLQLPAHLPEGRAIVTVLFEEPTSDEQDAIEAEFDRHDIEWWDEFSDDTEADEPSASAAS
jgi:hypothetical protein